MLDSLTLLRALGKLTMNQREAFIDAIVLERPHAEIAATMGVTRPRVGQLIRAAHERLAYLQHYRDAA